MAAFIYYLGAFTFAAGISLLAFAVVDRIERRPGK